MPGMRCTVGVCNNSRLGVKKSGKEICFYRFPKDKSLRQIWVQKCKRDGKWDPENCRVCSEHFTEEDYERDLQAELLSLPAKRKLKNTAVPSLNLEKNSKPVSTTKKERSKRIAKRTNTLLVQEILQSEVNNNPDLSKIVPMITSLRAPCTSEIQEENVHETLVVKYESLLAENEALKKQLTNIKEENDNFRIKINTLEKDLESVCSKLKLEEVYRIQLENSLKKIFTKAQREIIIDGKKRVTWSSDDISNAFAIRYFSKRCYIYLRDKKKYPLPGISSLQRWASRLNLRQGVLNDILRIMSIAAQEMSDFERVVVLQFDEVKVNSIYEYDKQADEVVGPHSQMQVVMVRGLFAKWKQPIYLDFDKKMTKDILHTLIEKLHDISYSVVACVSDCGGGNVGLWKELGIDKDNTYFLHPVTGYNVYFFADAPHLLKLIRNWLLDTGFILEDGSSVFVDPLKHLIAMESEVSSCYKITKRHLECIGPQRQNVSLAAQLLSHTTATALKHYEPGPDRKMAIDLGNFIEKINNWFDIFNSNTTNASVPTKRPYGLDIERQNEILDDIANMINGMKCSGKKSLQIFQKGILMSISSLRNLYTDMKQRYSAKYILTHKVNQDSLENFFSQIRGRGGLNDHPSPLDAIYRIRMIILGKNPGVVQKNVNTIAHDGDKDEYIVVAKIISGGITIEDIPTEKGSYFSDDSFQSSTSSESDSTSTLNLQKAKESDGVQYLAGWVAYKLKETHPDLGNHTFKSQAEHSYGIPKWVSHLSFGGLMEPTEKWEKDAKILNKRFEKFHLNGLVRKGSKITEKLLNIIKKRHNNINLDAARVFLRQRLFIRMKYLNELAKEEKGKKRSHSEADPHEKLYKKMKKIVN